MARKLTKEEIANGVFIDGSQLEKISDDVVTSYNNLELNSIDKKYQVTQVVMSDGYGGHTKNNVWLPSLNLPNTVSAPNYPLEGGEEVIKNKYRVKGYYDGDPLVAPTTDETAFLFWTNGMVFNKPVILINWSVYLQGADSFYTFDGEDGTGSLVTGGARCIIQQKNDFEFRDRKQDDVLLNTNVNLLRERFYGNSVSAPAVPTLTRFPPPPDEITGWYIEQHLNIPITEQGQVNFILSFPQNRGGAPFTAQAMENTKVMSTLTFLEEID